MVSRGRDGEREPRGSTSTSSSGRSPSRSHSATPILFLSSFFFLHLLPLLFFPVADPIVRRARPSVRVYKTLYTRTYARVDDRRCCVCLYIRMYTSSVCMCERACMYVYICIYIYTFVHDRPIYTVVRRSVCVCDVRAVVVERRLKFVRNARHIRASLSVYVCVCIYLSTYPICIELSF